MGRRMRNLRRGLGLIASCWVLSGTIGLVQAQSCGCEDAGACDCGAPVGVSYSQHVQCCTQKPSGPRAVERMLNSLDRMGNSFERRMASLKGLISLGSDCDSCDLGCDGACGGECASCNEGHASGMVHGEMHFGAWESYAPQSENGSGSWGIGETPSKESKKSSFGSAESLPTPPPLEKAPVNDHPISTPRGKSKETMPSAIPVPSKPSVPEDWKHNPFQDDARTYPTINSKAMGFQVLRPIVEPTIRKPISRIKARMIEWHRGESRSNRSQAELRSQRRRPREPNDRSATKRLQLYPKPHPRPPLSGPFPTSFRCQFR